jgi:hypothetical protein
MDCNDNALSQYQTTATQWDHTLCFTIVDSLSAPEGELVDRLRRSLDGMSWVHYTTGKVLETEISNIEYFGNVATYDAAYELKLKSGEMAGNMHVVMVQGTYGWRVSDITLF